MKEMDEWYTIVRIACQLSAPAAQESEKHLHENLLTDFMRIFEAHEKTLAQTGGEKAE